MFELQRFCLRYDYIPDFRYRLGMFELQLGINIANEKGQLSYRLGMFELQQTQVF